MILKCDTTCKDTPAARFQDKRYGRKQRVHVPVTTANTGKGGRPMFDYKCTVCSNKRGPSPEVLKKLNEENEKDKKKK